MAFQQDSRWTVVAWNEGKRATTVGISIPGASVNARAAFQTSNDEQLTPSELPVLTDTGTWVAHLAPQSIVTYTFG
jgi:hypothetical protein